MGILLRTVGLLWVLISLRPIYKIIHRAFTLSPEPWFNAMDALHIFALLGGIGLLLLKEWGRWVLLITLIGFFILRVFPYFTNFTFSHFVIRQFVFYLIFIVLLLIPHSKSVTKK